MAFGVKSAQDESQRVIDKSYEGLDGLVAILVYGSTREEHDSNLRAVLECSRAVGIKLNEEKLEVGVTSVQYFGHLLTADGLKPDPAKIEAIGDMEPPQNKRELETVLGMANYLAKVAPNLSEIISLIRRLLSQKVDFIRDETHAQAFQKG